MIVLQVIPQLDAGGAERTTIEVAEAIVTAGGTALVASEGGRLQDELAAVGGELIPLPMATKNPITLWQNTMRLVRLIRDRDVEIVHARSRAPAWSAKWAADRTDAHFVTTYHGTYNARSGLKRRYNSVMARGERVIANSQFICDHIMAEHGLPREAITVIPRGVDLDRFDPNAVSDDRIRALADAWAVDPADRRPVALFPARLTGWKGQREALRALGRIKSDGGVVPRLLLAGDAQGRDAYLEELEGLIAEHDLTAEVSIVGHCADMPAALALSDLVLTPSVEPEAFGRTAAEAGAMGKPVIAADHGGAREVVDQGVTGWRVAPGDPDALAAAISTALALDEIARGRMAEAARNRVREQFSATSLQAATLRVYREVLD